jgi:hypothetical protein
MQLRKLRSLIMLMLFTTTFAHAQYGITIDEVKATQEKWGNGIVSIGEVFLAKGDHKQAALDHILDLYDYTQGTVLFKPTLAADIPFRPTVEGALSYFVGGNQAFPEDKGFAIAPWTNVRFDNHNIITYGMKAIAMGHYYFTNLSGDEVKVEYTLGFLKRGSDIKITIQDSSLPYSSN